MANRLPQFSQLRRPLFRLAGTLLVGGLLLTLALDVRAQAAKDAKPGDTKSPGDVKSPGKDSLFTPTVTNEDAIKIINELIAAKWKDDKGATIYTPAEKCTDYEFIRRASLDIVGRIAKYEEIQKYMKDPPATRRKLLVDRLLASPDYTKNWSTMWTHWLMTRTGDKLYKDQIQLWLEEEMFAQETMSIKDMTEKLLTAKGKTNNNGEVNYILGHLGGMKQQQGQDPRAIWAKEGQFDMVPVTSRSIRLFLGYQIQCTQCHDHPFNAEWKQKHFWGFNAFFLQTERIGQPPNRQNGMMGMNQPMTLTENSDYNKLGIVYYEKRNGVFLPVEPAFPDAPKPKIAAGTSRREVLAKYITGHKNFSRAYVNRMWAHFFSRGMNEKATADDFGEHNPVVQEDLLDKVGEMFTGANYNPKSLIRWITLSDAYQLKAVANKTNDKAEDEVYYSRQMLKVMNPEQLLESLIVATRPNIGKEEDEQNRKFRQDWMNKLVVNFGDDEGNEITFNGTVVQALLMMNGRDINGAISGESGTVQSAKKLKGKELVDYLFLCTLNRPSTSKEYQQISANVTLKYGVKEGNDVTPAMQDLFWALLNCNEFILNH